MSATPKRRHSHPLRSPVATKPANYAAVGLQVQRIREVRELIGDRESTIVDIRLVVPHPSGSAQQNSR